VASTCGSLAFQHRFLKKMSSTPALRLKLQLTPIITDATMFSSIGPGSPVANGGPPQALISPSNAQSFLSRVYYSADVASPINSDCSGFSTLTTGWGRQHSLPAVPITPASLNFYRQSTAPAVVPTSPYGLGRQYVPFPLSPLSNISGISTGFQRQESLCSQRLGPATPSSPAKIAVRRRAQSHSSLADVDENNENAA